MLKDTIIDNEYITLWFYPELKIVHHEIKKPLHNRELQDAFNTGYDFFKTKGATKWLSDDRNNSATTPSDESWLRHTWAPKMVENGWKYWAIVLPQKKIGQTNMMRHAQSGNEQGLIVSVFNDPEEAFEWLKSQ